MQSLHLFIFLCSLVTMWAQCERCVCLSPLAIFPPSHTEKEMEDARLRSIANVCVEHTLRQIDALVYVCVHWCQEIWTDFYVTRIQSNSGSEDKIILCTLYCYKHTLNFGKITLHARF